MEPTYMPSISSVVNQIKLDYPQYTFEPSDSFLWSFEDKKIYYNPDGLSEWPLLFHELAHGLLGHDSFNHSLDLIQIERDAWDKAKLVSKKYNLQIADDIIEQSLDTYRDWIHKRSSCPECGAIGIESEYNKYSCLECDSKWKVNDARSCSLRRYKDTFKTR